MATNSKHTEGKMRMEVSNGKFPIYTLLIGDIGEGKEVAKMFTATMDLKDDQEANAKRIVEAWNNFDEMKKQLEDNHTSLLSIYNLVQSHFSEEGLQQLRSDMKANLDLLAKISSNK